MFKFFLLLSLATLAVADIKVLNDKSLNLYKYDPNDVYSLPEDVDDDKPAIVYIGDVKKAKVEKLQSLSGNKKYKLELKTQNGIEVASVGKLKDDKKTFVVSGSYSFTGADGKRYRTRYTADEFGYHPITEIDLDIPEPQPAAANNNVVERTLFGGAKNRFQFLNQNLDTPPQPSRGDGQSGDDYSYEKPDEKPVYESHAESGYDYNAPAIPFNLPQKPSDPARKYLPVL